VFSKRLRTLRLESGLTTTELGAAAGVSSRTISRWEDGEGQPSISQAAKIAVALGVSLDSMSDHVPEESTTGNGRVEPAESAA
jgi:transcriptional regulator with XRE-family HTH domain